MNTKNTLTIKKYIDLAWVKLKSLTLWSDVEQLKLLYIDGGKYEMVRPFEKTGNFSFIAKHTPALWPIDPTRNYLSKKNKNNLLR